MIRSFAALSLLLVSTTALAQRPARDANAWDVNAPPGARLRQVPINVDEGTWMNVDVSPDGRTIAFDLLGDIYTMPIARRHADAGSARASPSTCSRASRPTAGCIAFTSDRGGGDNIWVMNADGSGARAITRESFRLLNAPTWSRRRPIYRRAQAFHHPALARHRRDLALPCLGRRRRRAAGRAAQPALPEGARRARLLAPTARRSSSAATPRPATSSNMPRIRTRKCSRSSATTWRPASAARSPAAPAARSGRRPRPTAASSPTSTAPAAIPACSSSDLRSGEERQVYADLDQDLQETWAVHGVYPDMAWTPDSQQHRLLGRRQDPAGQPRRLGRRRNPLPGQRHPRRRSIRRGRRSRPRRRPSPPACRASPRSRRTAAGSCSKRSAGSTSATLAGGGAPRPLTAQDGDFQLFPTWSRDGSRIAFVSWNDQRLGEIRTVAAGRLEPAHGHPAARPLPPPALLARRRDHRLRGERQPGPDLEPLVGRDRRLPRARRPAAPRPGSSPRAATPSSAPTPDRVFVEVSEQQKQKLISVDLNGGNRREHAAGEMVTEYELSPDGRTLAVPRGLQSVRDALLRRRPSARRQRARHRPAAHPGHHQRRHLSDLDHQRPARLEPRADALHRRRLRPDPQRPGRHRLQRRRPTGTSLSMTVPADVPTGQVALVGARIVTMANDDGGIIDDGVILIDGNRIRAVGPRGSGRDPRRRAHRRRHRQDDHPRPDRRPRPWHAGRGRPHPAAELVGDVAPRDGRHHRPRPVEHGERDLPRRPRCSAPAS